MGDCMINESVSVLKLKLKTSMLIRFFAYPFQNIKRIIIKATYRNSKYSQKLMSLRDKYKNERCFIIGNGPSLTPEDLSIIKNEYSFAANKIFYLFNKTTWRPTFYSCIDTDIFAQIKDTIFSLDTKYIFISLLCNIPKRINDSIYPICDINHFNLNKYKTSKPFISENAHYYLSPGYTVTFISIQLAIYMGFKKIYLLGVDHNYSLTYKAGVINKKHDINNHFKEVPKSDLAISSVYNYDVTTSAYIEAKKYADKNGIKIFNATRGGALDVFERIDFNDLFIEKK